jgi:hypothetical protein
MKKLLPPAVLAGEGPQPDPRAAAAMQQQQAASMQTQQAAQAEAQGMAREKALLELREQAAKTALAEARAATAQAS